MRTPGFLRGANAKRLLVAVVTSVMASLPGVALASHGGIHPTFRTENTYFHCAGVTRLSNIDFLATQSGATWSTTTPTQGSGCASYDYGEDLRGSFGPLFEGTFTGNVRDLTVRMYEVLSTAPAQNQTRDLQVYVEIDGIPLVKGQPAPATSPVPLGTNYKGRVVTVQPIISSSGATALYEFSITNIGVVREYRDAQGNVVRVDASGAAGEDGAGTMEHHITIALGFAKYVNQGIWAWDTAETPAGIVFNPSTLATAQVAMDLP